MLSTLAAILENPRNGGLVSDGLVYRYPPQPRVDGLPGEEGTFNMCSFWLVEALTRAGSESLTSSTKPGFCLNEC
jgi:GH15 family glucan-1,4-alpha-glucosidase